MSLSFEPPFPTDEDCPMQNATITTRRTYTITQGPLTRKITVSFITTRDEASPRVVTNTVELALDNNYSIQTIELNLQEATDLSDLFQHWVQDIIR